MHASPATTGLEITGQSGFSTGVEDWACGQQWRRTKSVSGAIDRAKTTRAGGETPRPFFTSQKPQQRGANNKDLPSSVVWINMMLSKADRFSSVKKYWSL